MTDLSHLSSICCNALVRVAGEGTTHWWVCTACEQPTDVKPTASSNSPNVIKTGNLR
jgi:hypothetical protein